MTLRMSEEVVVLSENMADTLCHDYKIPGRVQVRTVPISIEHAKREVEVNSGSKRHPILTFGMVSRLQQVKRCDVGLRAFAAVVREAPMRLLVYGTGPEEAQLKKLALELDISKHVEFRGWIDNPMEAFEEVDCILLPSINEGTPRSLLESARMAVPAIASSVGGIPDMIEHEHTGWLIPPGDVHELTRVMSEIVKRPEVLSEVGARAKEMVDIRPSPAEEVWMIIADAP